MRPVSAKQCHRNSAISVMLGERMQKARYLFLGSVLCLSFFCIGAPGAHAHESGRSVEVDAGLYLIDVGLPDPVVAGQQTYLDFKLWQKNPADAADYTDVWVRIMKGDTLLLATGVAHLSVGSTGLLYTFPEAGAYQVSVRFEKGADSLAETEFSVKAQEGEPGQTDSGRLFAAALGFVGGVAVLSAVLYLKKRASLVVS